MRLPGEQPKHDMQCSRAGCEEPAEWAIRWRNPKIHAVDRHKHWLACADHVEYLSEFLKARAFPVEILSTTQVSAEDLTR